MLISFNIIKLLGNLIYDVTYSNFNLELCFKTNKIGAQLEDCKIHTILLSIENRFDRK